MNHLKDKMHGFTIAIDGPVASGKGTIAPLLSKRINGFHLYTGATYRALAVYGIEQGVDLTDSKAVQTLLSEIHIDLTHGKVILNGKDITERIKKEDASNGSSIVGVIPEVRHAMVKRQQEIAKDALEKGKIVIAEGRDTAIKVFPQAEFKLFLTASPKERARRRLLQLQNRGENVTYEEVFEDTLARDKRDCERETDPLVKDPQNHGYFVLDSTNLTEEQTIDTILMELERRKLL